MAAQHRNQAKVSRSSKPRKLVSSNKAYHWVKTKVGWRLEPKAGSKVRREQTLVLGNRPVTLEHLDDQPMTFDSRTELRKALTERGCYSPYFSKD